MASRVAVGWGRSWVTETRSYTCGTMPFMGGRLEGRRVLVVGGGRPAQEDPDMPPGTGHAISVELGRGGAAVAVGDRDADAAQASVDATDNAVAVIADVADPDGCA